MSISTSAALLNRFDARRKRHLLRAELRRRGSSESAVRLAEGCDPGSAEATGHVTEYLALETLERQLAQLTTVTLRRRMHRRGLTLPQEAACWASKGPDGVLTATGIRHVESQLRHERRSRLAWWLLLISSISALGSSAAIR